jgi:hypothetical protein
LRERGDRFRDKGCGSTAVYKRRERLDFKEEEEQGDGEGGGEA